MHDIFLGLLTVHFFYAFRYARKTLRLPIIPVVVGQVASSWKSHASDSAALNCIPYGRVSTGNALRWACCWPASSTLTVSLL